MWWLLSLERVEVKVQYMHILSVNHTWRNTDAEVPQSSDSSMSSYPFEVSLPTQGDAGLQTEIHLP